MESNSINYINNCIIGEKLLSFEEMMSLSIIQENEFRVEEAIYVDEEYRIKIANDYYVSNNINKRNYSCDKKAIIVLGLPSSGKSSVVIKEYCKNNKAVEVDCDLVKKLMVEFYDNGLGNERCHKVSKEIYDEYLLPRLVADGFDLAIPIIGKSYESFDKIYELLANNNYEIEVDLVRLPKLKALNRSFNRFMKTGRYVSLSYINSINEEEIYNVFDYAITLENVVRYCEYDNDVALNEKPIIIRQGTCYNKYNKSWLMF